MRWGKIICLALAAMSSGAGWAQQQQQERPNQATAYNLERNEIRRSSLQGENMRDNFDRQNRDRIQNLPKIRAKLATAWQHFGMSAGAAKMVADAYTIKVDPSNTNAPPSLKGRTDQEIAGMLQEALSKKQYQHADELLIAYERKRLHLAGSP